MSIKTYIESNKERFLDELFELIKIPSVSAVTDHNNDAMQLKIFEQYRQLLAEINVLCR